MLAEYNENGSLTTYYTRGEELISQERGNEKHYYLYDGFDSVRILTDEDGTATDFYTYDAFGNLNEQIGDTENDFLYRGEQFDSFTGLYYLRARYMNPSTGTFITMDEYAGSVFEPVSLHKYLYANANPVMNSDPTGYQTLVEVESSSIGMGEVSKGYYTASMAAFKAGMRILSSLLSPRFVIANTVLLPLIATLGNICSDLLSGNITSASICNEVKDNAKDDATNTEIVAAKKRGKSRGWIHYFDLDELGRATGAIAYITPDMLTIGTDATVTPYGFEKGKTLDRGHLIAKMLGGDGGDPRNITPIYHSVNNSEMKRIEFMVRKGIKLFDGLVITVIPHYDGEDGVPSYITYSVYGYSYRIDNIP